MPVDKFGRMSDAKTKDTGVSLTYINNKRWWYSRFRFYRHEG